MKWLDSQLIQHSTAEGTNMNSIVWLITNAGALVSFLVNISNPESPVFISQDEMRISQIAATDCIFAFVTSI